MYQYWQSPPFEFAECRLCEIVRIVGENRKLRNDCLAAGLGLFGRQPVKCYNVSDQRFSMRQIMLAQTIRFRRAMMLLLGCFGLLLFTADAVAVDQAVMQAFADHVRQLENVDAGAKRAAEQKLSDDTLDPIDRLTETLGQLYPDYATALSATDQGNPQVAVDQLTPMTGQSDLFLAADASFYLGRTLMNDERFEAALPLLERLADQLSDVSLHQDVVSYYTGIAQAGLLKNSDAAKSLTRFLEEYPNAPERLRVSAWRKVQELEAIEAGKLDDVYQRMDYSRRRLEHIKTGDETQEQQDKIVKLLSQLIKQEEKKEASSSSKKNNTKKQQKKQQSQQAQKKPKPGSSSKSSKGGSSSNSNGTVVDKSYDDAPASPWSRLRDRSRDPANNAVKDKLPARYRDIVEKYYEAANGNSGSSE